MCNTAASCRYFIQRVNPNDKTKFSTVFQSETTIGTTDPIFNQTKLSLMQIANSDIMQPVRIVIVTDFDKICGTADFTIDEINNGKT